MNQDECLEAIEGRLIDLENCLAGVKTDPPLNEQLRSLEESVHKLFSRHNEFGELVSNLKKIGLYNELCIDDPYESSTNESNSLSLDDKKRLIGINVRKIEQYLISIDELSRHMEKINFMESDFVKRSQLQKLGSISSEHYNATLDNFATMKYNYNKLLVRSIRVFKLYVIQTYEESRFYADVERKLRDLSAKVGLAGS